MKTIIASIALSFALVAVPVSAKSLPVQQVNDQNAVNILGAVYTALDMSFEKLFVIARDVSYIPGYLRDIIAELQALNANLADIKGDTSNIYSAISQQQ